ncbi:tyrosine-type recombinase/integrase [Paenibacillus sp. sgz500958]|uniref:tyrosine-type recombinase/integrase n=1 Tax=Paenibacillus sp. sgz500958 TaxID=3242475 RepID=UPI0036D43D67
MEILANEIQRYLATIKISDRRDHLHHVNLEQFINYLATSMGTLIDNIHLNRIYCIKDANENIIKYKPCDYKIIDNYLVSLLPCSYNVLLNVKTSLSVFFKWCERMYDFPNPLRTISFNIKDYKIHTRPARVLSRHEILRFMHCLVQQSEFLKRDLLFFSLLASTGCRISEILTLKVLQVDIDNEIISLPKTKSKKEQVVILRKGMGKAIHLYCKQTGLNSEDLIFTVYDKPMTYGQAVYLFNKYLIAANIPNVNIHTTRHSFATHLFENGADISIIQQLLRHADLQVTMDYVHTNAISNQGLINKQNEELYRMLKIR